MNLIQYALLIFILILAIPVGFLLAKLTKEELKQGRNAFKAIIIASLLIIAATLFMPLKQDSRLFLILSMLFLLLLAFISLRKSYKKVKLRKKKKG